MSMLNCKHEVFWSSNPATSVAQTGDGIASTLLGRIVEILLAINAVGMIGFWSFYAYVSPDELMDPEVLSNCIAEVLTAFLAIFTIVLMLRKSAKSDVVLLFCTGMLFFGSIQAIAVAMALQTYGPLALMALNMGTILAVLLKFLHRR